MIKKWIKKIVDEAILEKEEEAKKAKSLAVTKHNAEIREATARGEVYEIDYDKLGNIHAMNRILQLFFKNKIIRFDNEKDYNKWKHYIKPYEGE